jgi:hypothetical protein
VIVEDDQLSLAIGKKGQNVRLAAKLTKWRLDIKSRSEYEQGLRTTAEDALAGLTASSIPAEALAAMIDGATPADPPVGALPRPTDLPTSTDAPDPLVDASGDDDSHDLEA